MPAFEYKALDAKGKQGRNQADTARHARSQLRDQRMMPEILPVSKKAKAKGSSFRFQTGYLGR